VATPLGSRAQGLRLKPGDFISKFAATLKVDSNSQCVDEHSISSLALLRGNPTAPASSVTKLTVRLVEGWEGLAQDADFSLNTSK